MRRYDDPVEVRRGGSRLEAGGLEAGGLATGEHGMGEYGIGGPAAPEQFLWAGRLWKVRAVLAHWVETGPWWRAGEPGPSDSGELRLATAEDGAEPAGAVERELWRVEAGRASHGGAVFDLSLDHSDGRWQLVGCEDGRS